MLYYKYHENRKSKNEIEYGWVSTDNLTGDLVLCDDTNNPSKTNLSLLVDNIEYFIHYTNYSPENFIRVWSTSLKELKAHWRVKYPDAKENQEIYFFQMAQLLYNKIPFEMYGCKYSIVNYDL